MKKITQIWNRYVEKIDNKYNGILCFSLLVYFISNYVNALIKGGRWDLYQHIAMADRFLAGKGLYYSAVEASSPYFPGLSFLSIVVGKFFYPWRDYILLAIASLVGTLLVYLLIRISNYSIRNRWFALLFIGFYMYRGFEAYRSYMNEFKMDSVVLVCSLAIIYVIQKLEENPNLIFRYTIILFFISFVMDISKQQALYINLALGIYLLLTKKFVFKDKIKILTPLVLAGILDLIVVFRIPGAMVQTIQNLKGMPFRPWTSVINLLGTFFTDHIWFSTFLIIFIFFLFAKKIVLNSLLFKWLVVAVFWGIGQIIGGAKTGGNIGNIEVAFIPFLPFVVMAVSCCLEEYFILSKEKNFISVAVIAFCGIIVWQMVVIGYKQCPQLINTISKNKETANYLSEHAGGQSIMYNSNDYMTVANSSCIPGMDVLSTPENLEEFWYLREEAIKNKMYRYIYVSQDLFEAVDAYTESDLGYISLCVENLQQYYKLVDDPELPEQLQDKLYIVRE